VDGDKNHRKCEPVNVELNKAKYKKTKSNAKIKK
jgi:hypothetical protein